MPKWWTIDDLDELGTVLSQNPTTRLENFAARIDELASGKMEDRQGTLGVIKEILENIDEYKGKMLSFEKSVKNSDGENAFIDIYTSDIPPRLVERKWISSSTPVSEKTFIREFIKRDLFTATDLSQIVWSIKGNKLAKSKVVEYLKSTEGRAALNKLPLAKKQKFFKDYDNISGITDLDIDQFVANNFDLIFK